MAPHDWSFYLSLWFKHLFEWGHYTLHRQTIQYWWFKHMFNLFKPTCHLDGWLFKHEPWYDTKPLSKWAWVEEVDDEETGGCCRWAQEYDGAAEELGEGKKLFEEIHETQEAMCKSPMALFLDKEEWELARLLVKNVTPQATDEFLKMKGVHHS